MGKSGKGMVSSSGWGREKPVVLGRLHELDEGKNGLETDVKIVNAD